MADQANEGLLSPFLERRRIAAVRPFLSGRVLDVGCGNGALAAWVKPEDYVGIDIDHASIAAARIKHPRHVFHQTQRLDDAAFDTVTALAVIEHVLYPAAFLTSLRRNLARHADARIVCTTPHPSMDRVHWLGARIGLFSTSANEEHQALLARTHLVDAGRLAGLRTVAYRRFLFGANQIVSYAHETP